VNKIAKVTASFWVMKICATTLGETAGDLFSMTLGIGYALSSLFLLSLFLISLFAQLKSKTFHPFLFWTVILTTSTAGTTMSDYMDRTLGLGYLTGSLILMSSLSAVLAVWRLTEGSLAVDTIQTPRAEGFYWAAILCSNTLGTALGDYLADDSGLGFLGGALVIGALLAAMLAIYRFTGWNRIALFWSAFVLTRPFGATLGDFLTKPQVKGGLNLGTIGCSLILLSILVAMLFYTAPKSQRSLAANVD